MLDKIKSPDDIKQLNNAELNSLCDEIRARLIDTVSKNGGHLSSNLGCVELTVAMHRAFDSPRDTFLFDVGHQSYVHKLLTGRNDRFDTIRKAGGLSGFMNPDESEHDGFVSGHSSNSISAALGIATAKRLRGDDSYTVAVIGDGALTGGLAFEGLNNAARSHTRLIIILNDNKMSISRNVGAFSRHLQSLRMRSDYIKTKRSVKNRLDRVPLIGRPLSVGISNVKSFFRRALLGSNIFESIGFYYMGPVDGHNIEAVQSLLEAAKLSNQPVVLHVCTTKGKGYTFAERNPRDYHGVPSFDVTTGDYTSGSENYSSQFGRYLCDIAERDHSVCAITAAMTEGTGLGEFREKFKARFFDVGIAEQHAVTFAAGLARKGMKPVFAVYSSFLQRGYDQVLHDAAIKGEHIVLCVDRAGVVGDDGVTHQGLFDIPMLMGIPGVTIFAPSCYSDLKAMLSTAVYDTPGVAVVRYPRGGQSEMPDGYTPTAEPFTVFGSGGGTAVVTYGRTFSAAYAAANGENADVIKLNCIKPLDERLIDTLKRYDKVVFVEESMKLGSAGAAVADRLMESGYGGRFIHRAVDDRFVQQGNVQNVLHEYGLDAEGIAALIKGE